MAELAESWKRMFARDHLAVGGLYTLAQHGRDYTLNLVDGDRDGSLDAAMLLTTLEWTSQGFADPGNYR